MIKKQWELFSQHYLVLFFPHLGLVNLLSDSGDQSLIVKKKKKSHYYRLGDKCLNNSIGVHMPLA